MRIIHFGHLLSFEFYFIKSILFRTDLKLQKRVSLVRKNKVCSEFSVTKFIINKCILSKMNNVSI
ncbi:hypothetical protein C5473_19525 [Leptospira interrogans serovar Weerasinghe]|nr:hypothetical protein C5473_19525 [Leptospira interrogans serovar Weerasinghe]